MLEVGIVFSNGETLCVVIFNSTIPLIPKASITPFILSDISQNRTSLTPILSLTQITGVKRPPLTGCNRLEAGSKDNVLL